MFETGLPSDAAEDFTPQLPQTHPALTSAARSRIETDLRARRVELLEGVQRQEAALAQMKSAGPSADAERMMRERQHLALLDGELAQTTSALQRLAEGTYGTCERCGAPIPLRRLQIVPSARRCGECTPQ